MTDLANEGHEVIALVPEGTKDLLTGQEENGLLQIVEEFPDCASGVIQAFNDAIERYLVWRDYDVLVVAGDDFDISPDILNQMSEEVRRFDRYAIATPRSNDHGPLHLRAQDAGYARESLQRVMRSPFPLNGCVYIRGEILHSFAPLDESLKSFRGALREFALRINDYGYDCVVLNRVFVRLLECDRRIDAPMCVNSQDEILLEQRYPYLPYIVNEFLQSGIDPVDRFMPLLHGEKQIKSKILLNLMEMPPFYCGSSEMQLAFLKHLVGMYSDRYEFTVLVNQESSEFHHLEDITPQIVYDERDLGIYDLGFCAFHPRKLLAQIAMVNHCVRCIYIMLDAIMLRCNSIGAIAAGASGMIRFALENSDGIVAISNFSLHDTLEYYQDDDVICSKPAKRVYIATDMGEQPVECPERIGSFAPFEEFVLVAGNGFKHKALRETIHALKNSSRNYIVIGFGNNDYLYPNIYGLSNGFISDSDLLSLYRECSALVFPSMYEGFGLPITIALKCGKDVVVCNNDLNNELIDHFSEHASSFHLFDSFEEIPGLVELAIEGSKTGKPPFSNSWKDATVDLESFFAEILAQPVDPTSLRARWHRYAALQSHVAEVAEDLASENAKVSALRNATFLEYARHRGAVQHPLLSSISHALGNLRRRMH